MRPSSKTLAHGKSLDERQETNEQHKWLKPTCLYFDDNKILMLPVDSSKVSIDGHLSSMPRFIRNASRLLQSQTTETFHHETFDTIAPVVYMHQGEIGHASNSQYDKRGAILASDSATTCHVLAFRSYRDDENEEKILGSLCHLDAPQYESCIRGTVQEHLEYHDIRNAIGGTSPLCMEVHVVGGYNDVDGTSSEITNALFTLLEKISFELISRVVFVIKTCVVCGLNDCISYGIDCSKDASVPSPIMRGLAMDVNSGRTVMIQQVDKILLGPEPILRRARLWCNDSDEACLNIVHRHGHDLISIEPFEVKAFPNIEVLLDLPDKVLLMQISTSPECEAEEYCSQFRNTAKFLMSTTTEDIFGPHNQRKYLSYEYWSGSRDWKEARGDIDSLKKSKLFDKFEKV